MPRSLGVNENTYSRSQFYHDVQTYLRFKTPAIGLEALADASEGSPLGEIRRLARELRAAPRSRSLAGQLSYELRIFGCVVRANLRDQVRALRARIEELPEGDRARNILVEDIRVVLRELFDRLGLLLTEWRGLRTTLLDPAMPLRSRDTYAMVDEYISLSAELKLTDLIHRIDSTRALAGLDDLRGRATAMLLAERDYRAGAGYRGQWDGSDNESIVYRLGMLKKLITSVLWLEIDKQEEGRSLADVGAAFAAGVAMLFAVLATIMQMRWWMINTAGFVVAAVVTYMLKDRIKDWLKRFFHRRFSRFLADYNVKIRDPITGAFIGRSRESFNYVSEGRVPADVLAMRRRRSGSPVEIDAKREVVLKYDKEIRLESKELLERMHLESYDLNDISRVSLRELLVRADDPEQSLPVYDQDDDVVEKRVFHKVYHLNLVMVLGAGPRKARDVTMRHLRVVFDKHAIRRLEEVD